MSLACPQKKKGYCHLTHLKTLKAWYIDIYAKNKNIICTRREKGDVSSKKEFNQVLKLKGVRINSILKIWNVNQNQIIEKYEINKVE